MSLYPKGTKVSVANNGIHFSNPNILQGSVRFIQGAGREDLHNLFKPIQKSIEWFYLESFMFDSDSSNNLNDVRSENNNESNSENNSNSKKEFLDLNLLFDMSEEGLINLKECYEINSTIQHSLDYYIAYIKNRKCLKEDYIKNKINKKIKNKNIIHNYLKELWNKREIQIIMLLFEEYKIKTNDYEKYNIIITINNMTNIKEKLLNDFLVEHSSTL